MYVNAEPIIMRFAVNQCGTTSRNIHVTHEAESFDVQ